MIAETEAPLTPEQKMMLQDAQHYRTFRPWFSGIRVLASHVERLVHKTRELEARLRQAEASQNADDGDRVTALVAERDRLRAENDSLRADNAALKAELAATRNGARDNHNELVKQLMKTSAELPAVARERDRLRAENAWFRVQLKSLSDGKVALEAEVSALVKQSDETNAVLSAVGKQNERYREALRIVLGFLEVIRRYTPGVVSTGWMWVNLDKMAEKVKEVLG